MKIFELKLYLDTEQKTTKVIIGCDKENFDTEDLAMIEDIVQQFAKVVTASYIHKAVQFEIITDKKEGEA